MSSKRMKKLTPKEAWEIYVDEPIKLFISIYYNDGITDIDEMCKSFAGDVPYLTGQPFAQSDLDTIASLIKQYLEKEGYDDSDLYTKEELDQMCEDDIEVILKLTKGKL